MNKKNILVFGMLFLVLLIILPNVLAEGIIDKAIEMTISMDRPIIELVIIAIFSLVAVILGTVFLENRVEIIASKMGSTIGSFILALSSSLPLLATIIMLGIIEKTELVVSTIIATNIVNLSLVLGLLVLMGRIHREFKTELKAVLAFIIIIIGSLLLFVNLKILPTLSIDFNSLINATSIITQQEGFALIGLFALFLIFQSIFLKEKVKARSGNVGFAILLSLIGGLVVVYFAAVATASLVKIATHFNVPFILIGSVIVVLGTSMPELAVGLVAQAKNEKNLILTNIITSCVINFVLGLGIVAIIHKVIPTNFTLIYQLPVMLLFGLVAVTIFGRKEVVKKRNNLILIGLFVIYLIGIYFFSF